MPLDRGRPDQGGLSDDRIDRLICALPSGGPGSPGRVCLAVASFLGYATVEELQAALDGAGLLYQHPELGPAVAGLLSVELAEATLEGVLHQSLMRLDALTQRPQIFRWNSEAQVLVQPLQLGLDLLAAAIDLRRPCKARAAQPCRRVS